MELEKTPIYAEVENITKETKFSKAFYWEAKVLIDDVEYPIFKLLSLDFVRNYKDNIGDQIMMQCYVPLGFYTKKIYSNKHNMEINLYKKTVGHDAEVVSMYPYKGILVTKEAPSVTGKDLDNYTEEQLDNMDILTINIQLIDKSIEKLRMTTVGGIFRDTTNDAVVRGMMYQESKDVLVDGKPSVDLIDWVPTGNKKVRDHVVIPQGTKLLDVPNYVQEKCGGLYPTGLGNYMQNKVWWIYPLFNVKRFDDEERKVAMLFKVPTKRMSNIDRSYRVEDNKLYMLVTGNVKSKDDGDMKILNKGNGFRQADASQLMTAKALQAEDNKVVINRGTLNTEAMLEERQDGKQNAPLSLNQISSNKLKAMSDVASRLGGTLELTWENSDADELIPGMMVRFHYMDNEDMKNIDGVLHYSHTFIQLAGTTITSDRHTSVTYLGIFSSKVMT